jgi:hypothetical protein
MATVEAEPTVRRNRIGIDTGACWTGCLTCVVLEEDRYRFLSSRPTHPHHPHHNHGFTGRVRRGSHASRPVIGGYRYSPRNSVARVAASNHAYRVLAVEDLERAVSEPGNVSASVRRALVARWKRPTPRLIREAM